MRFCTRLIYFSLSSNLFWLYPWKSDSPNINDWTWSALPSDPTIHSKKITRKEKSHTKETVLDFSLWSPGHQTQVLFYTVVIYKVLYKLDITARRWILPFQCSYQLALLATTKNHFLLMRQRVKVEGIVLKYKTLFFSQWQHKSHTFTVFKNWSWCIKFRTFQRQICRIMHAHTESFVIFQKGCPQKTHCKKETKTESRLTGSRV